MAGRGCTDEELARLAARVGRAALAAQRRLSTAESCTGGWIAKAMTDIAGSSAWFDAGWVTYSNESKSSQLGVPAALIARHGAVSREVARAMASGALARAAVAPGGARRRDGAAGIAVAVTGIAGPDGGTAAKPVGTVWLCWAQQRAPARSKRGGGGAGARSRASPRVQLHAEVRHFRGDREAVRRKTVRVALLGLLRLMPPAPRARRARPPG
jgi:nicotinamide-nucleotide amidase